MEPTDPLSRHADLAHDPTRSLSRNAFALVLNAGATSALGAIFWVFAARLYSPRALGQDSALVSTMMMLSALSELNLGLALPRFLPQLGNKSARAVVAGYALSTVTAIALTGLTVAMVPHLSKSLHFIGGNWWIAVTLWASVVFWNIFAVQDAVLTALRRASWIPIENAIFGVAKLLLMIVWANSVTHGIFLSWVLPMAVMVVPVNYALFKWAIPHHAKTSKPYAGIFWGADGRRKVIRYLAYDYGASLLIQGATTMMPLLVIVLLGATQNAYFYVAFTVSASIDQLAHNVGLSLTVEGSFDESALGRLTRHTFSRFSVLLGVGVTAVLIFASPVLWFFGHEYSTHAATVLRLLAIGAIPQTVLNLYQAVERVRGNAGRILVVTVARFTAIVIFVILLGNSYGLAGVGWGWVIGHLLVMLPIVPSLIRVMRQP